MKRDLIQDIKKTRPSLSEVLPASPDNPAERPRPSRTVGPGRQRRLWLWLIVIVILFVPVFFISVNFFARAEITVVPKQVEVSLSEEFTALPLPLDGETDTRVTLAYRLMAVEEELRQTVASSGTSAVERRASGQIKIYNNFSEEPQALVGRTRFESTDGRIYRILDQVTVPGASRTDNGLTPGTVLAIVHADRPGAEFNLEGGRFSIPGFEGTPQFEGFYAEALTPITGGFIGEEPTVAPATIAAFQEEIESKMRDALLTELTATVPAGFVAYREPVFWQTTAKIEERPGETAQVDLVVVVKASALLFDEGELSREILALKRPELVAARVTIVNLDELDLELENAEAFSPESASEITFNLVGPAKVVWLVDEESLKADLVGKSKNDYGAVLANHPGVERAEVTFRPSWARKFPDNPDRIIIKISDGSL